MQVLPESRLFSQNLPILIQPHTVMFRSNARLGEKNSGVAPYSRPPRLSTMEWLLKHRLGEMVMGLRVHGRAYQSIALPPHMTAVGKEILRAYGFGANSAH